MKKRAVIIGVEEYDDPEISRLLFARADAESLARQLTEQCQFDSVFLLAGDQRLPTLTGVIDALEECAREIRSEDIFLFFFAGHGTLSEGRTRFLLKDSRLSFPEGSLSLESLSTRLGRLRANKRIILLDACRNSPAASRSIGPNPMGRKMSRDIRAIGSSSKQTHTTTVLLSACKAGQRAYEWPTKGHGVFTYFLLDGIEHFARQPGHLDFDSLALRVCKEVTEWSRGSSFKEIQEPWYEKLGYPESVILREGSGDVVGPSPKPSGASVSDESASLQCLNCQSVNAKSSRFCESCGRPMYEDCPRCGSAVRSGKLFCGQCGTEVEKFSSYLKHLSNGEVALNAGNVDSAVKEFGAAVSLMPDEAEAPERLKRASIRLEERKLDSKVPKPETTMTEEQQGSLSGFESTIPDALESGSTAIKEKPSSIQTPIVNEAVSMVSEEVDAKTESDGALGRSEEDAQVSEGTKLETKVTAGQREQLDGLKPTAPDIVESASAGVGQERASTPVADVDGTVALVSEEVDAKTEPVGALDRFEEDAQVSEGTRHESTTAAGQDEPFSGLEPSSSDVRESGSASIEEKPPGIQAPNVDGVIVSVSEEVDARTQLDAASDKSKEQEQISDDTRHETTAPAGQNEPSNCQVLNSSGALDSENLSVQKEPPGGPATAAGGTVSKVSQEGDAETIREQARAILVSPREKSQLLRRLLKSKKWLFVVGILSLIVIAGVAVKYLSLRQPTSWEQTYGGSYDDEASSVQQTTDGGYVIAGCTSPGGFAGRDAYVLKLNSSGTKQWEQTFGGSYEFFRCANSIQQTSDGGYIVTNHTDLGFNVLKLDASGATHWVRIFNHSSADEANSIQQTLDGGYVVAGRRYVYTVERMSRDVYVLKLDAMGDMQWENTFGDIARFGGTANSIQQTSDGGYVVAGWTEEFRKDVYVLKLTAWGSIQWEQTFGGSDKEDEANSIQQTSDGGYIVAGLTDSKGARGQDVYVLKLSASGGMQWEQTFGGSDEDEANSIQQTSDGGYIVAGSTHSKGAGGQDVYVLKLSVSGGMQWERTFGGSNDDEANSIQQTSDGGYVVAGSTGSKGVGGADVYVLKLDGSGNL